MKRLIVLIALICLTAAPAVAASDVPRAAHAKIKAEQRVLTERIASRIKQALESEPYTVEQSCQGNDCTISIYR
jgi:hypothetical protein